GYAFRRAGVSLAHTEGFHPLPKLTFGPALPLGFEARGEVLDFVTEQPFGEADLMRRLNAQLPPGLLLTSLTRKLPSSPKLHASLNAASYAVSLTQDDVGGIDLAAAIEGLLSRAS